jgi:hypothetical protein
MTPKDFPNPANYQYYRRSEVDAWFIAHPTTIETISLPTTVEALRECEDRIRAVRQLLEVQLRRETQMKTLKERKA